MTVAELMTELGTTPNADYVGEIKTNNMVLAVDITGEATDPTEYAIATVHMEELGAEIDADTEDSNYLYEGKSTTRTDANRTFGLSGKRYHGDDFQDWLCSHDVMFGTGEEVKAKYVYFNVVTGEGETGTLMVNVTSDGSGEGGNIADIEAEATSVGIPSEYTYTAAS